jgi:hypothetical protein
MELAWNTSYMQCGRGRILARRLNMPVQRLFIFFDYYPSMTYISDLSAFTGFGTDACRLQVY